MKDLSFFLVKNSLGAKMKKGLRSFCNGVGSTSTLNQQKADRDQSFMVTPSLVSSSYLDEDTTCVTERTPTLEEMILQLELEEEAAKKAKLDEYGELQRRMSCVNNSDILRCARNALNQYPRFSLDGRDAMYRSSFRKLAAVGSGGCRGGRKSVCSRDSIGLDLERTFGLPPTLAGENVVWCKPGVVAKLMGLEAMPVPIGAGKGKHTTARLSSNIRKINLRRAEQHGMEKRNACGRKMASFSTNGYCVVKPIPVGPTRERLGLQTGRAV